MSGRGDKNKKSTSGRGSSNQSNQPFHSADQRSNRNKRTTGGSPSQSEEKTSDASIERNRDTHPEDIITPLHGTERNFNMLVDSVPYLVQAIPFDFNGEKRYRVSINGNEEHIFTWDSEMKRLAAIDDDAATIPDNLEVAISDKLQSRG
jgi:hypothetical protein